jgi:hypothetical protein
VGINSGYQTVTPIQFANIVWAIQQKAVRAQSSRVYFGCFVLIASRLAAARVRRKRGEKCIDFNRYRIEELVRITGLTTAAAKRGVRELSTAGLLTFTESEVIITSESLPGAEDLAEMFSCRRSDRRPIPVPRIVLRHFASTERVSLVYVMIAYLLRGLSIARKTAVIGNRGTVKASWIAEHFGLSVRSVRYMRQRLYAEGWITRDTQSFQRKLNRDGAYFVINLGWSPQRPAMGRPAKGEMVGDAQVIVRIAPLPATNCTPIAPPREDKETSNEIKNQKAQGAESEGVCKSRAAGNAFPSIRRITVFDLKRFDRLHELYRQAVKAGWLQPSEANALNFVGAAVRAREVEGTRPAFSPQSFGVACGETSPRPKRNGPERR